MKSSLPISSIIRAFIVPELPCVTKTAGRFLGLMVLKSLSRQIKKAGGKYRNSRHRNAHRHSAYFRIVRSDMEAGTFHLFASISFTPFRYTSPTPRSRKNPPDPPTKSMGTLGSNSRIALTIFWSTDNGNDLSPKYFILQKKKRA